MTDLFRITALTFLLSAISACVVIEKLPKGQEEQALRTFGQTVLEESGRDFAAWRKARLADQAYPIYRPDLDSVAYYEFPVVSGDRDYPTGFMLLATGPHDYRVVQWSTEGRSNAELLLNQAKRKKKAVSRIYLIDVFSFVAEDSSANVIATLGQTRAIPSAAEWKKIKSEFPETANKWTESLQKKAKSSWATPRLFGTWCDSWVYGWAGTDDDQRWYTQIPPNTPPNTADCFTGCGATAWMMLFGWADYRASEGDPMWDASYGMFGGVAEVAPDTRDADIDTLTLENRDYIETACQSDQGRTWPWDMDQAKQYLSSRTNSSPSLTTNFNTVPIPTDGLRDRADASIRGNRPPIIAQGVEHYSLAYGYRKKNCRFGRDKHEFKINTGWGYARWTSAGTWFVGQIRPYPDTQPPPGCPDGQKCCFRGLNGLCRCVAEDAECPDYAPITGCPGGVCCEPGIDKCKTCAPSHLECPIPK